MTNAHRVARMVERATLETMMERIAEIQTPRLIEQRGPETADGFQLGIMAAVVVLKAALEEIDEVFPIRNL